MSAQPRVVLICHAGDALDAQGLAAWLATSLQLAGVVMLHESLAHKWRRIRGELRRIGWLRFLDVLAFRLYYGLRQSRADGAWMRAELARLRARYPAPLEDVPRIHAPAPDTPAVRAFLEGLRPDAIVARCKFILKPEVFDLARAGSFAIHPGICPEYRNAHGCFWALARRDLGRVGMTLLRIDRGIDTGPILLQASCPFDEARESHVVIQYRVVLENLDAIAAALRAACAGNAPVVPVRGRRSAAWGQPSLTAYLKWKRAVARLVGSWTLWNA